MFQSVYYKVYRFLGKLKKKFFSVFFSVRIIEIHVSYIVENCGKYIELK